MNDIKEYKYLDEAFYKSVKEVLEQSRKRIYRNIQSEMVLTYWQIGKMIVEKQGGESRAKYGDGLIKELSMQMTKDYGKGFTGANLRYMRLLFKIFPNCHALSDKLSWTHYRLLISLDDENVRNFYIKEVIEGNWSTRQLESIICHLMLKAHTLCAELTYIRNVDKSYRLEWRIKNL